MTFIEWAAEIIYDPQLCDDCDSRGNYRLGVGPARLPRPFDFPIMLGAHYCLTHARAHKRRINQDGASE